MTDDQRRDARVALIAANPGKWRKPVYMLAMADEIIALIEAQEAKGVPAKMPTFEKRYENAAEDHD
jgi:hypothetical protein